ncbi:MAG: hypothetical protein KME27_19095 [Lyngbya sp. HA4199-MV5]|jgi:hypothetical protein|nr:hypothetical protein [Lyngbya sp. HA4199-MV5]
MTELVDVSFDDNANFDEFRDFLNELEKYPESLEKLKQDVEKLYPPGLSESVVDIQLIEEVKASFSERVIRLGHDPLPGEVRIHKHSWTDIRTEGRACRKEVYLKISHPKLDTFFQVAYDCAIGAAIGSVITAAASGAIPVAYAIFYPLWKACMLLKVSDTIAKECKLSIFTQGQCGCWDYHDAPDCRFK